jgi:hypothetical protein
VAPDDLIVLAAFGAVLAALLLVLLLRRVRRARTAAGKAWVLVDGSNVMHWQDNSPRIEPLGQVVGEMKRRGYAPCVVFDANAGWKLAGRYLGDAALARLLDLPAAQVLVVPKGTPADPYILETARDLNARIVTNDRYRDWADRYPLVNAPGFLIRGGWRDGGVWVGEVGAEEVVR